MGFENRDAFNPSYIGPRRDVVDLIPNGVNKLLDIGCSVGELGWNIKQKQKGVEVVGIEVNQQMAKTAKEKLNKVIVGNIEEIDLGAYFPLEYFDCIVFADVLEHLKDPWNVLKTCCTYLNTDGTIVASIPNIRHYTTAANLLFKGYWPYRERGIHDRSHLRFFTLRNIKELFEYANLEIIQLKRNYRIIERPHVYNKFAKYFALPPLRELLTFQYLIVARKSRGKEYS